MPGLDPGIQGQPAQCKLLWIAGSSPAMTLETWERCCYNARMDIEDLVPKKPKGHEVGADLSKLSVGELKELIETLRAEIARVEQTLATKQSSKSAAESVFKR